jgi:hypothetical protein
MSKKNGMSKNVGETGPRNKADVTGNDMGLASSGMLGKGVNRDSSTDRYSHNQFSKAMGENYGMGPRVGNKSDSPMEVGPSATHDKRRLTISTAAQAKNSIESGFTMLHYGNPDKINVGNK